MMTKSFKERFKSSQTLLSMLVVQVFATGMQLLSRVILVHGTFIFALSAYRHIVAAFCVAPFAFYFERSKTKKFSLKVWFWIFINALVGMTMALGLFYYGIRDTSATYSVNVLNLVPICTFVVSIICRMEKLGLKTWAGKAKTVGAILCVGGALATSLYKGTQFYIGQHHIGTTSTNTMASDVATHKTNMLRGTFFLIGSCFSYTAWFIVQVKLLKEFPFKYWGTMLACVMAATQSAIIGVCIDSSKDAWKLQWNLQLITILYSGALASAATFCLLSWTISVKGPTYPPMFNPLSLVFVALAEALLLGEPLSIGTILGMILIISGLYCFLWGKKKERKNLIHPNVVLAGEVSTNIIAEPVEQATAVVVPSSSPNNNCLVLEIDCSKTDTIIGQ